MRSEVWRPWANETLTGAGGGRERKPNGKRAGRTWDFMIMYLNIMVRVFACNIASGNMNTVPLGIVFERRPSFGLRESTGRIRPPTNAVGLFTTSTGYGRLLRFSTAHPSCYHVRRP